MSSLDQHSNLPGSLADLFKTGRRRGSIAAFAGADIQAPSPSPRAIEPSSTSGHESINTLNEATANAREPSLQPSTSSNVQDSNATTVNPEPVSRKRSKMRVIGSRKRVRFSDEVFNKPAHDYEEDSGVEENLSPGDEVEEGDEKAERIANKYLPYRSFVTINMPKRSNADKPFPGNTPDPKDPSTLYGTMSWEDSMITFWCDGFENGWSYTKGSQRFELLFRKMSAEMIRRRHTAALGRQYLKYGLKKKEDIPEPDPATLRRGQKRQAKKTTGTWNGVTSQTANKVAIHPASGSSGNTQRLVQTLTAFVHASRNSARPTHVPGFVRDAPFKQLEMTAIVVCKDLFGMNFVQIRNLLAQNYDWSIGPNTIVNYYNFARPLAYGSKSHGYYNIDDFPGQEAQSEDEDMKTGSVLAGRSQAQAGGKEDDVEEVEEEVPETYPTKKGGGSEADIDSGDEDEAPGAHTDFEATNNQPVRSKSGEEDVPETGSEEGDNHNTVPYELTASEQDLYK